MSSFFLDSFEANFGLSSGRVLGHVYGRFVVPIGTGLFSSEIVVSKTSLGRKIVCTGAPKVPWGRNCVGSKQLCVNHCSYKASNFGQS